MQNTQPGQQNNFEAQNVLKSIQSRAYSQINIMVEMPNPENYIDASYQNGPYVDSKRELSDKFCFYAFIIGLVSFFSVFIYSLVNGDVEQILIPFNDSGQKCGIDLEVNACPYSMAYKMEFVNRIFCVADCPNENQTIINCKGENYVSQLNYTLYHKVCINDNHKYFAPNFISYQRQYWINIIIICILTFYCSHFLTDLTSRIIKRTFILIKIYTVLIIALIIYYIVQYFNDNYKSNIYYIDKFQLVILILALGMMTVLIGFQIFLCKYKEIIIVIVYEALRFYKYNQYLILFTMVLCLAISLTFIIYYFSIYYLISCGKSSYYEKNPNPYFELSTSITVLIILQSFTCFWIISFLTQVGKFLVSLNSAKWYFRRQTELLLPTRESIYTCFRFHVGSIALGALLFQFYSLANVICVILQPLMNLYYYILKAQNKIELKNLIFLFNGKSFTILAMNGSNLLKASRIYGKLIERSKKIIQFSDILGEIIAIDIKLILANYFAQQFYIDSPLCPFTLINFLISYSISNCVINNWSFAADTILVYYFLDKETNRNEKWTPIYLKGYLDAQEGQVRIQNQINQINFLIKEREEYLLEMNRIAATENAPEIENINQELNDMDQNIINAYNYLEDLKKMYAEKKIKLGYNRLFF